VGPLTAATLLTLALALVGCGGRGQGGAPAGLAMRDVGTLKVGVATSPDPPRTGENTITIVARDSEGRPMRGTAELLVSMPAMGAMPYMESRGKIREVKPGVYRAEYGLAMNGEWDVALSLKPESGPPAEAMYRLSTSVRGVAFSGGTAAPGGASSSGAASGASGAAANEGAVLIDPARRQSIGIRTAPVEVRELDATLRAPGRVAFDEAHQAEVSLRFSGWAREVRASVTGQAVRQGDVLFTVYSPELWGAQQEYLDALRATRADSGATAVATSSRELAAAARERLHLWGVADIEIAAIERAGGPREAIPVRSPVSGVVTEKNLVAGSALMPGQMLYRIARLDPVWILVDVPQSDLPLVRPGMTAIVSDADLDRVARRGRVAFIAPSVDSMTRTGAVRIEIPNPGGRLRPGAYVEVELVTRLPRRLAVPESAVIPTGERHVVFVDLGDGRLAPRQVRLGRRAGGFYEVLEGLAPGEIVVTSGNFVVAAESNLRSVVRK
jgi:Cu(I)/Ag(I) efflux system membrane fusion protein